jgi:hypothetical protein
MATKAKGVKDWRNPTKANDGSMLLDVANKLLANAEVQFNQQVISATGSQVITIKSGTCHLTAGGVTNATLAAPTAGAQSAGGDDGKQLRIYSETAQAHTVTNTTPGFNNGGAASDVGTFAAAIGNQLMVEARNGIWWVIQNVGVTLA